MSVPVCLQCGVPASAMGAAICRRCGTRFGAAPRDDVALPSCFICYRTVDADGRLESLDRTGRRVDLQVHLGEHDRHPVGDDDWLETLRAGDRIAVGRWRAPYDVVRRYLVTGSVVSDRRRTMQHDAIVTAMTQLAKWGPNPAVFGDQVEWREARDAVSELMERYHRGSGRSMRVAS